MELNRFIELFSEQLDETNPESITKETKFHELDEWSSLIALSIIAMIDEEYDIVIKGDDIKSATTIEDLFNVLKNKE